MPCHAEWLIPLKVIAVKISGVVTLTEWNQHTQVITQLLAEAQSNAPGEKIAVLADTLEAEQMLPLYTLVSRATPILRFRNRGTVYLVTRSNRIRTILNLTAYVMHFQVQTFADRETALQAIEAAALTEEFPAATQQPE